MGRWVTSKGRRIYIPDEGEENPFAKNKGDKDKKETSGKSADKTENQRREDDLKKQLEALKGKEFNKDARVVIDDLRARLDEHRRFEGAVEDMDERLKELKKKEAQITKTDAFNPQARKTLKDLRARIDEINQMNRNDAHEPTSYKNDKTSKIISDNEAKKEKQIAANKKQADEAGAKKDRMQAAADTINKISTAHNNRGGKEDDWKQVRDILQKAPVGTVMEQTGDRGVKFQYEKIGEDKWKNTDPKYAYESDSKTMSMSWVGNGHRPSVNFTTKDKALTREQVKAAQDAATSGRLNQALGLDKNGNKITRASMAGTGISKESAGAMSNVYDGGEGKKLSRAGLVTKSVPSLKSMYKNASPEEKKIIASELNARGYYGGSSDGRWKKKGGGR